MKALFSRFAFPRMISLVALLVGACNSDPGIDVAGGGNGGGNGNNNGGNSGSNGGGGSGSGNNGGGGRGGTGTPDRPPTGGAGGSTTPQGDKTCSATSAMAKPLPVDIFVLLDRSNSMREPIADPLVSMTIPPSKWDSMLEALSKFVSSPSAEGIQLGLGMFPASGIQQCDQAIYAMPAVPIAALPGVATPFMDAVKMAMPLGRTPTLPALQGAVQYARQREMTMQRRVAIALATDGEPNQCNSTVNAVSNVAQMAAAQGIYTFVIGVGPSLQNLNAIAMAGGTKMAYLVEMATADQLAAAFKAVQMQASRLACSFMIPPPPAGMSLDPNKVNVRFTATNATNSFDIGQVPSRDACGPQGGWYFDNPSNPTRVNLCDASCQKVNGSGEGEIQLLFGCASVVIK